MQAIRTERWKLVFPHVYRSLLETPGADGAQAGYVQTPTELALYDLNQDPGETTDVQEQNPDVVAELEQAADRYRSELGDRLTETIGSAVRPAGQMEEGDERLVW